MSIMIQHGENERNPVAVAYYSLGNALYKDGQIDESIANYRKAIDVNPGYALAYTNLGKALREKGKIDEAVL